MENPTLNSKIKEAILDLYLPKYGVSLCYESSCIYSFVKIDLSVTSQQIDEELNQLVEKGKLFRIVEKEKFFSLKNIISYSNN